MALLLQFRTLQMNKKPFDISKRIKDDAIIYAQWREKLEFEVIFMDFEDSIVKRLRF